ncbi:hypothetical protein CcCBS67573_g07924 [Chytriomyces confervae]|uniref:Uncharacterized protein n=1 Tax=Chytriomyces confervae TaxID=246404 RepID=A0A507ES03_9FUNG|nr:hypothetical protein CcCBS67573_g07924 [Chytriomyces confervae]
MVAMNSLSDE